jgi:hypothetical protein
VRPCRVHHHHERVLWCGPDSRLVELANALEQRDVEGALYVAALRNGLVHDDGQRQTWATIRSGLSTGLQEPISKHCLPRQCRQ